jgi:hypothetical protein
MTGLFEQVTKEMKSHPITLVLVLLALGSALFGWANYARASEVKLVEAKVDRVLELQMAATLRSLQTEYCRANGNKAVIAALIDDHQSEYRKITGQRYPLIKCEK